MDVFPPPQDQNSYEIPPIMNPPPQIFGGYGQDSPHSATFPTSFLQDDLDGFGDDSNDPKRRRIARVPYALVACRVPLADDFLSGMRYVSKKEDQV